MKKILFVSDVTLSNPSSGSEQVLHNQARALQRLGYDIRAITRGNDEKNGFRRRVHGVLEVCYYANPARPMNFAVRVLKSPGKIFDRLLTKGALSVIVCHQPYTCFSLLLSGRIRHIPKVYVFHSPSHEEYLISKGQTAGFSSKCQAGLRKTVEGFCLKRSQIIMVLSMYMKHKVASLYGISGKKIIVNPGGVDIDRFTPARDRSQSKEIAGFTGDRLHLLTVRNLEARMGLENLIEAIDLLKKRGVDCQLIIGGSGPEKERLESMVHQRGLGDDISLAGYIPAARLPEYYRAADFFIIPTRLLEGFGLVTPESMACETPVLGTPVGGIKEILSHFNKDLLFRDTTPGAMADGLEAVIAAYFIDKQKYQAFRQSCRKHVLKWYTWDRHVKKLSEMINALS